MKNRYKYLLAYFLCALTFYGYSNDISQDEMFNSRLELLESGEQIRVPESVINIPGQPIVVPPEYFARIEAEKLELIENGYIDKPNIPSIATKAFRDMRSEFLMKARFKKGKRSNVEDVFAYDFSKVKSGKINPQALTSKSKGFIIANQQAITRVYSDTKFGDIYINEMIGGTMGVIRGPASPNLFIGGYEGYKTKVRYEFGKIATLVLINTENGVSFIEIGDSFSGKNNESDLHKFLLMLVTDQEAS